MSTLEEALQVSRPEIFNSDQGSQFTSEVFTAKLLENEIRISMDSRGRAFDNIFVERLWRSVKYEDVYLKEYRNVSETKQGLWYSPKSRPKNSQFKVVSAAQFNPCR